VACGIVPETAVEVGEYSGRSTSVPTPVSFGAVFKDGDIAGPSVVPSWGGVAQPAQVEVLSTWPSGTAKHARISFLAPQITANSTTPVTLSAGSPTIPQTFTANVVAADLWNYLEILRTDGTAFKATLDTTTAGALLADAVNQNSGASLPPGFKRNAFGKLMCEYEAYVPLLDPSNVQHPWIKTLLRVRIWSGWPGASIEWSIENSPTPSSVGQAWVFGTHYGSLAFTHIKLFVGLSNTITRYAYTGFPTVGNNCKIMTDTRCRVTGWTKDNTGNGNGGPPPLLYTIQDHQYLATNLIVPRYDYTHPISSSVLAGFSTATTGEQAFSVPQDLTANPNGTPYLVDPFRADMAHSGGSDDRGPLTTWDIYTLNSAGSANRANAWKISYAASCNGAGTYGGKNQFTIHARDPVTGAPGVPGAIVGPGGCRDQVWANNGWTNSNAQVDNYTTTGIDFGHSPQVGYVMWLLTAESWFAEELCFWGIRASYRSLSGAYNDGQFSHGLINGLHNVVAPCVLFGDRYGGWPMRDASNAAFLLPDNYFYSAGAYCNATPGDTIRDYAYQSVKNTMDLIRQFRDEGVEPLHLTATVTGSAIVYYGDQTAAARDDFQCGTQSSGWANAYFVWSMFQIWGYFRSKGDSVALNAERNFDWYSQQYAYAYLDPRVYPQYHQRSGYACFWDGTQLVDYSMTYRLIDWSFNAPDRVNTIDWASQTVGFSPNFDRRLLWLSTYSLPIAVFDTTPNAGYHGGCGKRSSNFRTVTNLGELAWYLAVNVDMKFNSGPPINGTCPISSHFCALPQVDWNNNGKTPPWPPEAWRVCGWSYDGGDGLGANFHDRNKQGEQSAGSYNFHFPVPCMATFHQLRGDAVGAAAGTLCWSYLYPFAASEARSINPPAELGTIIVS